MESRNKYHDFSFVNRKHHTACLAGSEPTELTLHLQKRTPDPFTVPASARDFVKVKDCKISKENVLLLCQTARVYCNSYNQTATRKRLDKRIEDVTSRRRAKRSQSKLIPLEGYESSSQRRHSPSPRTHSPSKRRHSLSPRRHSPSPRRHSPSPKRHVPTRGHLSRRRSTSQPTKTNTTSEPSNEPLNPYRVLPNIHSNRKLSTELSPHDRESSRSSSKKRYTENQASSKYDKYQSQYSQNGKLTNTRSTKENVVRSEGDHRDSTFISETKYKRTVTYGSKEDEKRFYAKRGHDSDDDYSDNE